MSSENLSLVERLMLKDVESWTAADLVALVQAQIPEGMRVEYKRELNLGKDRERAEVAKDVSGLANAQGGLLIYGVEEDDSPEPLPARLHPMPADGRQAQLENILDSTLEPRADFHAATVPVDGGTAIVVRVAPRGGNPIMVQGYGEYRYYRRSGTRTRRMDATEVAEAHSQASERNQALMERLSDLPLVARIIRTRSVDELRFRSEQREIPTLTPVVTILVAALDGSETLIDAERMARRDFPESSEGTMRRGILPEAAWALTALGCERRRMDAEDDRVTDYLAAVYRPGVVEWARRYPVPDPTVIPSTAFAEDAHDVLLYAARVFDEVGYAGRVATWIRVENADAATLGLGEPWNREVSTFTPTFEALNGFREVSTDELLSDPMPTVRHAMDLIWQGFGVRRCLLFDTEGNWQGSR